MGTLDDRESAERLLMEARRNIAAESDELVFMEAELAVTGEEILWGEAGVILLILFFLKGGLLDSGLQHAELPVMEAELAVTGEEILWGEADDEKEVRSRMETVLRKGIIETMHRSCTLKINDFIINLSRASSRLERLMIKSFIFRVQERCMVSMRR